jgi:uncharacterized membrane protein
MNAALVTLTVVTVLGCGLNAGVFFAFSGFVMKALARLPAAQGIAAMQAINAAAVSAVFMIALFGTAAACLAVACWALTAWDQPFAPWLLAGGVLYLIGVIVPTVGYHVPRNDALARVEPAAEAALAWALHLS